MPIKFLASLIGVVTIVVLVSFLISDSNQKKSTDINLSEEASLLEMVSESDVIVTDRVRHTVPLDEILSGGPPKDGIPPIDNPKFISIREANEYLEDNDPGIAVELQGINRFYPFQILVWHEIVNDTFNGQRVLVTYCPLCLSGIVFDPVVRGERVEFGTSGKLWNSNLVMYDRKTDSYWSQILGESIVGSMAGTKLKVLPSDQMLYGGWKKLHSKGEVLSRETGAKRFYGMDPYGSYYTSGGALFPVNNKDNRLDEKDFILGIIIGGESKAYLPEAIKKIGMVEDTFAGETIVLEYDNEAEVVRIFIRRDDESLERINPFPAFWFSWVAVHPDTKLYK